VDTTSMLITLVFFIWFTLQTNSLRAAPAGTWLFTVHPGLLRTIYWTSSARHHYTAHYFINLKNSNLN
jgi:hypothetical protein